MTTKTYNTTGAFYRVASIGTEAMKGNVPQLLQHIPSSMLSGDPQSNPAIRITCARSLRITITRQRFTIRDVAGGAGAVPDITIDLGFTTLGALATAIQTLSNNAITATLVDDASRLAIVLLDQSVVSNASVIVSLMSWHADTWRVLNPLASALEHVRRDMVRLIGALDLRTVDCDWISIWGEILGIPRLAGEDCEAYRRRLIYSLFRTRCNNRSLEIILRDALGINSEVTDDASVDMIWNTSKWAQDPNGAQWAPAGLGSFTVTTPEYGDYSLQQVIDLITTYKAAGTVFGVSQQTWPWRYVTTSIRANLVEPYGSYIEDNLVVNITSETFANIEDVS